MSDEEYAELVREGCSVLPFQHKTSRVTTSQLLLVGRFGMNWLFLMKEKETGTAFTPGEKAMMEKYKGQIEVAQDISYIKRRLGVLTQGM